ncbi:Exosome complex component rrp4 [Rhizina undulata]
MISILPPKPAPTKVFSHLEATSEDEDELRGFDEEGDVPMGGAHSAKKARVSIVTPGEVVTSDPQWMRGHGTYLVENKEDDEEGGGGVGGNSIVATVAGTVQKVNKLLSVKPLRARYNPEIGDLIVGRIVEVQSKRWKVDINSHQNSVLLLSSINLPGGILRKRTSTDELQIRTFFSEGDLLVAEVQSLFQDGAASLHTRSLKYGKLRNGYFLKVDAKGILRSKSHVLTIQSANGGGEIDVILGVNGYIWIAKKVGLQASEGMVEKTVSITRLEEEASEAIYSNVNEVIAAATRREISRIGNCIRAMVRWNVRVDEDMLNAVYEAALEEGEMEMRGDDSLEGDVGRRAVEKGLGTNMRL